MEEQPEEELTLSSLVTVAEDLEPYVLQWLAESATDGVAEALVLVVAKRQGGLMLAVPLDFIPAETLQRANEGHEAGPIGASTVLCIPSVIVDNGIRSRTGTMVSAVVVDVAEELISRIRLAGGYEDIALPFDLDSPFAYPDPALLLSRTMEWVRGSDQEMGLAFYSAEDLEEEPPGATSPQLLGNAKSKARQRRSAQDADTPTGGGGGTRQKRVTTASLAASMNQLLEMVPNLSSQIQTIAQRQEMLENRVVVAPSRAGALGLSQPLSSALASRPTAPGTVAQAISTPPPRTTQRSPVVPGLDFQPRELLDLEEEKVNQEPGPPGDLAQAMMAQSKALTALVGQIAMTHQDPLMDLGASSSSASTRGFMGRAKLQAELASHSGSFYMSVLRAMSRRMQPTATTVGTPAELLRRGVCGTLYMERFGGFGRHRDLGLILYQVMTVMDFMQAENMGAAQDALALLAVCLDQAVLDNGKFDLAALLTLQEDPPSTIFVNRQQSTLSRTRAFSPLADQRWVTVALAFIKELDVITTKRQEITSSAPSNQRGGTEGAPARKQTPPPKRKKGGGRGAQAGLQEGEED